MRRHLHLILALGLGAASVSCQGARAPSATFTEPRLTSVTKAPAEPFGQGIVRRSAHGASSSFARWDLAKGALIPEHSHPNEQTTYVISGEMAFTTPVGRYVLRPGDVLQIPSDVPHAAEALEDTVEVDFFTPRREDWLNGVPSYLRQSTASASLRSVSTSASRFAR